jgi:hypothetical protein
VYSRLSVWLGFGEADNMGITLAWIVTYGNDIVTGPFEVKDSTVNRVNFYNRQSARANSVFFSEEEAIKFALLAQAERRFNHTKKKYGI